MKKKNLIFPIVLCLLLLYRGLNQLGIRIENDKILVVVMWCLCLLTLYDFIVKFKIWLQYNEEKDCMKKALKETEKITNGGNNKDQLDSKEI